ncbi:single-stranded DNA-binding protein [Clostridia bacterium]|nr:single-stranded DNA-binding protein [Clostridia bacterium]
MFNKVVLIGRLTRDPELRFTQNGKAVASFSLAVDRAFKREGQPEADFFRISVWGKQAENCANYLSKGSLAAIDGRIEMNKYTDKDGQERTSVDVTANDVRFLSSPGGKKNSQENNASVADSNKGDMSDFSDDGLPF